MIAPQLIVFSVVAFLAESSTRVVTRRSAKNETPSFSGLVKQKDLYVDKSLFIWNVLQVRDWRTVCISRPRRVGKSANLDMLKEFLDINGTGPELFKGLQIMDEKHYQKLRKDFMKQYIVLYLNFDTVRGINHEIAEGQIYKEIKDLYHQFKYLKDTNLSTLERSTFERFESSTTHEADYDCGIGVLCDIIFRVHKIRPVLIIDGADTPLVTAFNHGYLSRMSDKMASLYICSLKANRAYSRAILCSVLPLFHRMLSIVNGNTVGSFQIFDDKFDSDFGFTEGDVKNLIERRFKGQGQKLNEAVKKWYGGLKIGQQEISTPASVKQCLLADGNCQRYTGTPADPHWEMASQLLGKQGLLPLLNLQILVRNERLRKFIPCDSFKIEDIRSNEAMMWYYLINAGFVTVTETPSKANHFTVPIRIPGRELQLMLDNVLIKPMIESRVLPNYTQFTENLRVAKVDDAHDQMELYIREAGAYLFGRSGKISLERLAEYVKLAFTSFMNVHGLNSTADIDKARNYLEMNFFLREVEFPLHVEFKLAPGLWDKYINSDRYGVNKRRKVFKLGDEIVVFGMAFS